jgi:HD-like signal output (HDOD) protein
MKTILFVEDNAMLRELYGMMMEEEQAQWQTALAPDGESALKLMQRKSFDVVASDLQMPGMNGIELLTQVRQLHPQSSRIIISGYTDQAQAANSLKCTHLFIPKPFDSKVLHATLARICNLDAYLKDNKLRSLASHLRTLPSFPTMYSDIMREMGSPHCSIQAIASIVARDPGITAKVLQVANSAAVGLPEKVSNPVEAVQRLGLTTIRSIVLSAQVYGNFATNRVQLFSAEALWSHLMKCGNLARSILRQERAHPADAEEAFTAGLLHDIGKLMLADSLPDELSQAMTLAEKEGISQVEAEEAVLGANHAGLAGYLLGLWGLPATIVEAVAFHHAPEKSGLKQCSVLTAVHLANAVTGGFPLNREYLQAVGVSDRLEDWRAIAA